MMGEEGARIFSGTLGLSIYSARNLLAIGM
jgi:hypothetical protein